MAAMDAQNHNSSFDFGNAGPSDVPVKVGRGPYRRFSRWIEEELLQLVARWAHTAAPIAGRGLTRSRNFSSAQGMERQDV
jgi:hypothetical protein